MDRIAAGRNHTLIVDDDGFVWTCGDNTASQLGNLSLFSKKQPKFKKLKRVPEMRAVCASFYFSLFIDKENQVWGCGNNVCGQLGVNKPTFRIDHLTKMENVPLARSVACEYHQSLLLDEEGYVWSTGENAHGQLGLGDNTKRLCPEKIEGLPPIKSISCGIRYSMLLDFNGYVWTAGQIAMKSKTHNYKKPTLISGLESIRDTFSGSFHSICINEKDEIIGCGKLNAISKDPEILNISLPPMVNASASTTRSLFIDHQGSLWGTGKHIFADFAENNDFSYTEIEYKMEESVAPFTAVSAGHSHTILVSTDGSVYTTGSKKNSALGLGSTKIPASRLNKIPKLSVVDGPVYSAKSARNV